MTRILALIGIVLAVTGAAQEELLGPRGLESGTGRPFPWAELTATLLTLALLLWAVVIRREE